jgi:predicted nucleic acid-binding protein
LYLLDTNIFLEVLLDQEKAAACRNVIETLSEGRPGWVTSFSRHAIEAIMGRKKSNGKTVEIFLSFLDEHPYLFSYTTTLQEEFEIAKSLPKTPLDFDDALQYYVAKKKNLSLVTLDRDFTVVKDIPVIAPEDI